MGYAGADVTGKVVLITGGGTGIGAAIAERYAAEGAHVVVVGRRQTVLDEVAQRIGALALVADAADAAGARGAVEAAVTHFGRLDVLVNNAGGHGFSAVGDTDDESWAASLQANLNTAFVMSREALPALIESKGQIVVISSLAGLFAGPSVAGYTVGNDLSARDLGFRQQVPETSPFRADWIRHKSFDGSCPLGPWITPAAYIADPSNLAMKLSVNDVLKQNSNSGQMIFNMAEQISHLSTGITLHPGDMIMTGTPAGVGAGRNEFLKAGDVVRAEIAEIGSITNTMA